MTFSLLVYDEAKDLFKKGIIIEEQKARLAYSYLKHSPGKECKDAMGMDLVRYFLRLMIRAAC